MLLLNQMAPLSLRIFSMSVPAAFFSISFSAICSKKGSLRSVIFLPSRSCTVAFKRSRMS